MCKACDEIRKGGTDPFVKRIQGFTAISLRMLTNDLRVLDHVFGPEICGVTIATALRGMADHFEKDGAEEEARRKSGKKGNHPRDYVEAQKIVDEKMTEIVNKAAEEPPPQEEGSDKG